MWICVFKLWKTFSSVQSLSRVELFATPWIAARQASLSITNSRSWLKLMSIELVMPSSHLILCHPLLLLPPIPPNIRVFSNESVLCMRWPKYWSFSFSISPSNEHPGLISFRMDWLDLLSLQHQTLLLSPVTSTAGYCFCFGSIPSFFLELFLHWSPVAYWAPTDLGSSSFSILSFCLFILFVGFSRQEYWSGSPVPSPYQDLIKCMDTLFSWVGHPNAGGCHSCSIKRLTCLRRQDSPSLVTVGGSGLWQAALLDGSWPSQPSVCASEVSVPWGSVCTRWRSSHAPFYIPASSIQGF